MPRRAKPRGRQALGGGRQVAQAQTIAAPIGGWNARDNPEVMKPTDAVDLVNWFPRQTDLLLRPGSTQFCDTGTGTNVRTLIEYEYGGAAKTLACTGGKIFEISTGTASSLKTGLTSDYWHSDQMIFSSVLVNGVDTPQIYNGSTLSDAAYTMNAATPIVGFDQKNFTFVMAFKSHLYFIEKNTQRVWYTATGAINGQVTLFDLSLTGRISGNLIALATLSKDGGNGQQDLWLAISSNGDVIVYQGSSPDDSTTWTRVGTVKIGRPLSSFGTISTGADVLVLTNRGYENFLRSYQEGEALKSASLASDKIQNAVAASIGLAGTSENWNAMIWSGGQMLIVTVPTPTGREYHVRNTTTGAWCKFTGFTALSWCKQLGMPLYGSSNGKVYRFGGSAVSDAGTNIATFAQLPWNYLGYRTLKKLLSAIKITLTSAYMPHAEIALATNFGRFPVGVDLAIGQQNDPSVWGVAEWNISPWSSGEITQEFWHNQGAEGRNFGVQLRTVGHKARVGWNTLSYIFQPGGLP